MEIKRAIDLGGDARDKISELFVDGFYDDLKPFSKDKAKLAKACAHMFILRYFYVAIIDGEIAGIIACLNAGDEYCVQYDRRMLVRHLGLFRGVFACFGFRYLGRNPKYPREVRTDEKTASIEFVVTGTKYRKMGVATAIMDHLLSLPEYRDYVLEVVDTNTAAVELYKKLGFEEVHRRKFRWAKHSDFDYFVYMKCSRG